jgi:lipopolysaccharide transport system permease protein
VGSAAVVIRSNTNLVKRVVFPLEILPLNLTLVALVQQLIGMAFLLPLAWAVTGSLYWTLLYLPLILLIQFLFTTGLNWMWASLAVYLPDLRQVTGILLMMLMFLTPIFYPKEMIPEWAVGAISINPLTGIVDMYRKAIMTGEGIPVGDLLGTGAVSLGFFMLGYFWFMRTKKGFADVL